MSESLSKNIDKDREFFIRESVKDNYVYLSIDKQSLKEILLYFLKISDVYLKPQTIIPKIIYFLHIHRISYPHELSKFFNYSYGSLQLTLRKLFDLGIIEIIGTGHSSFAGSPSNRRHNIDIGAESLNGTS